MTPDASLAAESGLRLSAGRLSDGRQQMTHQIWPVTVYWPVTVRQVTQRLQVDWPVTVCQVTPDASLACEVTSSAVWLCRQSQVTDASVACDSLLRCEL